MSGSKVKGGGAFHVVMLHLKVQFVKFGFFKKYIFLVLVKINVLLIMYVKCVHP